VKHSFAPLSRQDGLVVQNLSDEVLIYDLKTNKAFCLNETSALVWNLCDGKKSVVEISQTISRKLNSAISEDFVWLAIDQLKKENLLSNGSQIKPDFNGLSRREAIRKIGLTSMIALPVVTSLIAPRAVDAASPSTCSGSCRCSTGNINSSAATFCRTVLGGNSQCDNRGNATCDCLVVAGIGSRDGTCQGV
jgi:hypothetical protein